MAVQLRDAKITVKLDLKDGEKAVGSLEKRTVKQRKEAEKDRRAASKEQRKLQSQAKRRPSIAGRIAGGGLYQLIASTLRAIPFGVGLGIGIGIANAELSERYGPAFEGFINRFIARALEKQGIPIPEIKAAAAAGREYGELKSKLASLTAGFDAAVQMASADILTGGTVTADEFAEQFMIQRRMAEFTRNFERGIRGVRQQAIGSGAADSVMDAIEKATTGSLNK